jgi:hypothetical protein
LATLGDEDVDAALIRSVERAIGASGDQDVAVGVGCNTFYRVGVARAELADPEKITTGVVLGDVGVGAETLISPLERAPRMSCDQDITGGVGGDAGRPVLLARAEMAQPEAIASGGILGDEGVKVSSFVRAAERALCNPGNQNIAVGVRCYAARSVVFARSELPLPDELAILVDLRRGGRLRRREADVAGKRDSDERGR